MHENASSALPRKRGRQTLAPKIVDPKFVDAFAPLHFSLSMRREPFVHPPLREEQFVRQRRSDAFLDP